jgi:outer membrane protein assembly factor BamB
VEWRMLAFTSFEIDLKIMNQGIACLVGLGLGLSVVNNSAASADDNWPQWRGPHQNGVAPKANPPTEWSETKNVKWKVAIPGEGHATPIIWGDKVFVLAAVGAGTKPDAGAPAPAEVGQGQERPRGPGGPGGGRRGGFGGQAPTQSYQFTVMCLDRGTGKTVWQKVAKEALPHEGHHPTGTYASPSPVTDGENLYAYFGSQGLYCYEMNGNVKWSQDLGDMKIANSFGEGSSPAIHGDTLVVVWDNEADDFIAALNKKDGKVLWKQPREERTAWSTPLIVEHGGKAQVITTATGKVRSYDLKTGELVWEHAGLTRNTIPSPVTADGVAYVMSGFQGNALYAIKLGKTGDLTDTESVIWKHNKSTPYVPSPLLSDNRLYFFSSNNEILSCFDAKTGKPHYEAERIEGIKGVYASPIAANDRVYLVGRNGGTVVIKDSDKLEVLATNALDEKFDSSPVAVGKELFLRGHSNLYCIAEK